MRVEIKIIAYDEHYLYLSDGSKIAPPSGCKFDVDIIRQILASGDE